MMFSHELRLKNPLTRYLLLNEGEGEGGDGGGSGGGGDTPPGIPQSKVDDIVKGRVAETKRQTEERIAKELGCSISEAKDLIASARKREDDEKSEAQREREAAEREKREAEEAKAAAQRERFEASVERALIRAGIDDAKISRAIRLLDVEADADAEAIKKAVEALKSEEPAWFGEGAPPKGGTESDPKGKPPVKKKSEDAYSRGLERAKTVGGNAQYPLLAGQS